MKETFSRVSWSLSWDSTSSKRTMDRFIWDAKLPGRSISSTGIRQMPWTRQGENKGKCTVKFWLFYSSLLLAVGVGTFKRGDSAVTQEYFKFPSEAKWSPAAQTKVTAQYPNGPICKILKVCVFINALCCYSKFSEACGVHDTTETINGDTWKSWKERR